MSATCQPSSFVRATTGGLYLEPGVTVLANFGDVFVGADVNAIGAASIRYFERPIPTFHAQVGMTF